MDIIEFQNNTNENRHPWELARLEVVYSFISKHLSTKQAVNILDVGCGDTFVVSELLKKMPNAKFHAVDIEFTAEMIEQFQDKGIELYQHINELENRIEKANLVLLMDVIEHIEDEKAFLKDLIQKNYISNDTLFLITVPAYQSLFSEHDVFLKHYRRYSRKQLNNVLKESGFEIIESGNFFSSLIVPRLLSLAKERLFSSKEAKGLTSWKGSKKQSNILKEVLYLDFKTTNILKQLGVNLPGLSTYSLCRRPVL
jgi:SAM-dependent methyltransferase